jgi:hypothetical protein
MAACVDTIDTTYKLGQSLCTNGSSVKHSYSTIPNCEVYYNMEPGPYSLYRNKMSLLTVGV